jgi:hypothetical protein
MPRQSNRPPAMLAPLWTPGDAGKCWQFRNKLHLTLFERYSYDPCMFVVETTLPANSRAGEFVLKSA